jgi:hypothetical protein
VKLCRQVLQRLSQLDNILMFAELVTEDIAANYYDVIRTPMALSTMKEKCERWVLDYCIYYIVASLLHIYLYIEVCTRRCRRCARTSS